MKITAEICTKMLDLNYVFTRKLVVRGKSSSIDIKIKRCVDSLNMNLHIRMK